MNSHPLFPAGVTRYDLVMASPASEDAVAAPHLRRRADIPDRFKWNLTHIFPDLPSWQAAYAELETKIAAYAALHARDGVLGHVGGTR